MARLDGYNAPTSSAGNVGTFAPMGGGSAPPNGGTTVMRSYPQSTLHARANNQGSYTAPPSVSSQTAGPVQPVVPDINTFLNQDSDYQAQQRDFANALAQFNADITRRRGNLQSDYQTSQNAMNEQKVKDLQNLEADYAARGMIHSGLYGQSVGDYNNQFNNRMTDLSNQENQALDALTQQSNQFTSQQDLQNQAAREDAIRRRASQYGVTG